MYTGENTPVCLKQMCSYRDRPDDFAALDATIVGISAQDLDSHQGFIDKNSLTVPLLADVDKQVAKTYSALGRMGTKRAVIVIDEDDVVEELGGVSDANCVRKARIASGWRASFATWKTWRIVRVRACARV